MDFDEILKDVDEFGTYQRLLLAFVLLPAFIPCGFHAYNQLFMAATPDHWCKIPGFNDTSGMSVEEFKNFSIPVEERDGRVVFSQCSMYDIDNSTLAKVFEDGVGSVNLSLYPIVPCKYGWDYDFSTYTSTIVTEWDIVCDRGFYPTLALILLAFSGLVGYHIFGILQDSLGRRPAFFIYLTIECIFGVACGFSFDFWSWLVTRIGVGFTVPAIQGTPLVLALELVGPSHRTLCTVLLNISYSLCLMGLAGVAWMFRGWRSFAFATVLPFISFFAFWWILPESPRWLFARGKLEETETILRQIAHVNGRTLPSDYGKYLQEKYESTKDEGADKNSEESYSTLDLLRGPVLRRNTLIITFIWFINLGVYVGLSYYAPALGGDEYLNFFLAGLAEMPTYLVLLPILDHWGRRWTLFLSMVIGGVACVCTILVQEEAWITLTLYCIGKFGISAAFVAVQQFGSEIYPTVVRGRGISFSTVVGMIGPVVVPLVNYTGQEYLYLPLLTLGALMVVGGVVALALPETLGRSLPQTLADAEEFSVECTLQSCLCPQMSPKSSSGKNENELRNRRPNNYAQDAPKSTGADANASETQQPLLISETSGVQ